MKKELTNEQINVLNKISKLTKMDCWFAILKNDSIFDLEDNKILSLKDGIEILHNGISGKENFYLTNDEYNIYLKLLLNLGIKKLNFNDLKRDIQYIDIKKLILIFVYIQSVEKDLFDINFTDTNNNIYEVDEEGELIIEFVQEKKQQNKMIKWMIEHNEDFISIDCKIY